jgi:hypothetical protein
MASPILPRRRLLQVSVLELFLGTTSVVALLVCCQAFAPFAIVYTAGFIGGLLGTAIGMNRREPRLWEMLCIGGLVGVCVGWIAAIVIGALPIGFPLTRAWRFFWRRNPVTRTIVVDITTELALTGGLVATALYASLAILKARAGMILHNSPETMDVGVEVPFDRLR